MTERALKGLPDDAAGWDARLRAPDCSAEERAAFKRWCEASLSNQAAFDELQALLAALRSGHNAPEIRSLREAALNAAPPVGGDHPRLKAWGLAVAAAVALAAVGLTYFSLNEPVSPVTAYPPSFVTAVGERSTTNFEDGTVAVLNTNTQLEVAYSDRERLVTLKQGQALFDVAKDPERPFVVVAGEQRITAIGTVFDVRIEGDAVLVTLVEGIVDVVAQQPIGSSLNGPGFSPTPVRLMAGQQLLTTAIATPAEPIIEDTDVEQATIWRQGRAFFEDVPLSEAVAEMNRYSTTQIVVADAALDAHRVNGMFRTGQQANFVDALEAYFPLEVERVAENRIVLKAKRGQ